MSAPMYVAMGGAVFVREHAPITMERARMIEGIHRLNASNWLTNGEDRTQAARIALAKTEMRLADEMAAAIAEITNTRRAA